MSELQQAVMDETERRMAEAIKDLKIKYSNGNNNNNDNDNSITGPTGTAYKNVALERQQLKAQIRDIKRQEKLEIENEIKGEKIDSAIKNDENFEETDKELEKLRNLRLKELQLLKQERLDNIGKGHGSLVEINQDEFLKSVTGSNRVLCLFYHKDFERCKIMSHHLEKLAPKHIETKFIKIDAERAPFFVQKLLLRTMPTVVCFVEGIAIHNIVGFEELCELQKVGHEDEWPTINLTKLLLKHNMINNENIIDEDAIIKEQQQKMDNMRSIYLSNINFDDDDDVDFDNTDI